ncbi:MAG: 3-dehydroquinate synthase [Terriglobia bacterium]
MQTLQVKSKDGDYAVVIGEGAWRALGRLDRGRYSSIFVLTEAALWKRWCAPFLKESGLGRATALFVAPGESSKSLPVLSALAERLLKLGADRRTLLVLFGGGVIGDLGGFLAAVYMRGIDYVNVPTTVLAQVDSSIGGKTAVNLGAMKNLLGAFYPPRLVLSEPRVLSSLSSRDFRSGLYEAVKHAVIQGPRLFSQLEKNADTLSPGNFGVLARLLPRIAKVKVAVVNEDEREACRRAVLNLGHTFGHALEEATGYTRFVHGEAVAWGIIAVARLAVRLARLEASEAGRIERLVWRLGPLPAIRDLSTAAVVRLLPQDKKAVAGKIHWVLPEKIGAVRVTTEVPIAAIRAAFEDVRRMSA